ncbi:MAG: sensor histidine kinase [Kangiellaceae bacterium]
MLKTLKKLDHFLLPRQDELQYGPYIWLLYLFIFFVSLSQYHPVENSFIYSTIGTLVFLALYFNGYWANSKNVHWNIIGILVIGTLMTVLSPGASVFFVYAGAFCCRLGSTRKAVIGLAIIAAWIGLFAWIMSYGSYFYIPGILFTFLIGGVNIYQHDLSLKRKELILTQQEVRHLARTSERERIARDLHDLIGHTFSVITLKAELANKLIDKDLDKARAEISSLENLSREALSQVREVVTGYRTSDLNTELAHAKYTLESNEIQFDYQFEEIDLNESINKELAIILKELVTNILKHSQATKVSATISPNKHQVQLLVEDNGIGFQRSDTQTNSISDNNRYGLKGIAERVNKMDGDLTIESNQGTRVKINIPLKSASEQP